MEITQRALEVYLLNMDATTAVLDQACGVNGCSFSKVFFCMHFYKNKMKPKVCTTILVKLAWSTNKA